MKNKIIGFITKQVNLILELGKEDLVPSEYIAVIIDNYDFIINLDTKDETKNNDKELIKSLSTIISNIK